MCISNFQAASGGGMLIELAANERAVHGDFFNSKKFFLVLPLVKRDSGWRWEYLIKFYTGILPLEVQLLTHSHTNLN